MISLSQHFTADLHRTFIVSILRIVYYLQYDFEDPSCSFPRPQHILLSLSNSRNLIDSFLGSAFATPAEVFLAVLVASAVTWLPAWRVLRRRIREALDSILGTRPPCVAASSTKPDTHLGEEKSGESCLRRPEAARVFQREEAQHSRHVQTSAITPLYLDAGTGILSGSRSESNSHSKDDPDRHGHPIQLCHSSKLSTQGQQEPQPEEEGSPAARRDTNPGSSSHAITHQPRDKPMVVEAVKVGSTIESARQCRVYRR